MIEAELGSVSSSVWCCPFFYARVSVESLDSDTESLFFFGQTERQQTAFPLSTRLGPVDFVNYLW